MAPPEACCVQNVSSATPPAAEHPSPVNGPGRALAKDGRGVAVARPGPGPGPGLAAWGPSACRPDAPRPHHE
ncbi:unnamed protein product [Caretta caretta]